VDWRYTYHWRQKKGSWLKSAKPTPKAVRDAVIADLTGHLVISLWEDLVNIIESKWYTFLHIATKQYNGLKLRRTKFSKADEFNSADVMYWDNIPVDEFEQGENRLSKQKNATAAVLVSIQSQLTYTLCVSTKCARKVLNLAVQLPIVSCSRKMLARKCPMAIYFNFDIAVDGHEKSLTIFEPVLKKYFNEDIIKLPSSDMETRLLLLEAVDFTDNSKNFIYMKVHAAYTVYLFL